MLINSMNQQAKGLIPLQTMCGDIAEKDTQSGWAEN